MNEGSVDMAGVVTFIRIIVAIALVIGCNLSYVHLAGHPFLQWTTVVSTFSCAWFFVYRNAPYLPDSPTNAKKTE